MTRTLSGLTILYLKVIHSLAKGFIDHASYGWGVGGGGKLTLPKAIQE